LDANYFQHIPYLTQFSQDRNLQLAYTASVHIEPMGIYSKKIKALQELPSGAQVAIPNDPTNTGRALALLAKAGLLKLKEGVGVKGTVRDITDNPKGVVIRELEAALLPRFAPFVAADRAEVRREAWKALGKAADERGCGTLLGWLPQIRADEMNQAESAVRAAAKNLEPAARASAFVAAWGKRARC
jgi:YaeC family lipoprotein